MASSSNHQYIKLIIYIFVLYVTLSSLLAFSDAAALSQNSTTRGRRLFPYQKKTVRITNKVLNKEVLNAHCSSSEDDLGLRHLVYTQYFEFSFRVNWTGSTKFRCHFTWRGGGDHWFLIYKDGRDGDHCDFCSWSVVGDGGETKPMVLTPWRRGLPYPDLYYDWNKDPPKEREH